MSTEYPWEGDLNDEQFAKAVSKIEDLREMLECVLHVSYMIGDSYYRTLTDPVLERAEQLLKGTK